MAAPGSSTSTSTGEQWDWRKSLDHDDIHGGQLTVPLDEFEEHLLPKMTQDDQNTLRLRHSVNVTVVDVGRGARPSRLLLMKFSRGNPPHYRFGENWRSNFVQAGGLKEGLPIALRCVDYNNNKNKKWFEFMAFPDEFPDEETINELSVISQIYEAALGSSTSTSTGEQWDWTKSLDHDDIHGGHLTVPLDEFEEHLLPKMTQDDQNTLRLRHSVNATVVDVDREARPSRLLLMKFSHGNPPHYRFGENWRSNFVQAGGLMEGFPIGLRCVDYNNNKNKKWFEFTAFPYKGNISELFVEEKIEERQGEIDQKEPATNPTQPVATQPNPTNDDN